MELAGTFVHLDYFEKVRKEKEQRSRMNYKNDGVTLPQTQFVGPGNRVVDENNINERSDGIGIGTETTETSRFEGVRSENNEEGYTRGEGPFEFLRTLIPNDEKRISDDSTDTDHFRFLSALCDRDSDASEEMDDVFDSTDLGFDDDDTEFPDDPTIPNNEEIFEDTINELGRLLYSNLYFIPVTGIHRYIKILFYFIHLLIIFFIDISAMSLCQVELAEFKNVCESWTNLLKDTHPNISISLPNTGTTSTSVTFAATQEGLVGAPSSFEAHFGVATADVDFVALLERSTSKGSITETYCDT